MKANEQPNNEIKTIEGEEALNNVPAEELVLAEERRSRHWPVLIGILAVIILASAAFLGAQLFNARQAGGSQGMFQGPVAGSGPGRAVQSARNMAIDIEPAEEIPTRKADKVGMIKELKDKSLLIGVGNVTVSIDASGEKSTMIDETEPATEVVITADTKLYRDASFDAGPPQEGQKIQQVVEPISFSDLQKDNSVSVWGYKRGDRLIAEVILYIEPVMVRSPE